MRRLCHASRADGPARVIQVYERRRKHIHVRIPQARYRADVAPVAVKAVRPELFARREHIGDDIFAEVLARIRVCLVLDKVLAELFPVEYINAHRGKIALGLLGLFLELLDIAVRAEVHDAEAGHLLHGDLQNGDGARRVLFHVLAQHFGIVHLINVVARENEHVVGVIHLDEAHVLINGVGRAGKPRARLACCLVRRQDENSAVGAVQIPGLAAAYVAVELKRPVLREHAHGVDAGVCAVGQGEIYNAVFSAKGHIRLCHVLCERIEP